MYRDNAYTQKNWGNTNKQYTSNKKKNQIVSHIRFKKGLKRYRYNATADIVATYAYSIPNKIRSTYT